MTDWDDAAEAWHDLIDDVGKGGEGSTHRQLHDHGQQLEEEGYALCMIISGLEREIRDMSEALRSAQKVSEMYIDGELN